MNTLGTRRSEFSAPQTRISQQQINQMRRSTQSNGRSPILLNRESQSSLSSSVSSSNVPSIAMERRVCVTNPLSKEVVCQSMNTSRTLPRYTIPANFLDGDRDLTASSTTIPNLSSTSFQRGSNNERSLESFFEEDLDQSSQRSRPQTLRTTLRSPNELAQSTDSIRPTSERTLFGDRLDSALSRRSQLPLSGTSSSRLTSSQLPLSDSSSSRLNGSQPPQSRISSSSISGSDLRNLFGSVSNGSSRLSTGSMRNGNGTLPLSSMEKTLFPPDVDNDNVGIALIGDDVHSELYNVVNQSRSKSIEQLREIIASVLQKYYDIDIDDRDFRDVVDQVALAATLEVPYTLTIEEVRAINSVGTQGNGNVGEQIKSIAQSIRDNPGTTISRLSI